MVKVAYRVRVFGTECGTYEDPSSLEAVSRTSIVRGPISGFVNAMCAELEEVKRRPRRQFVISYGRSSHESDQRVLNCIGQWPVELLTRHPTLMHVLREDYR